MINLILSKIENKYIRRIILITFDCFIISTCYILSTFITNYNFTFREQFINIIFTLVAGINIYILSGQYQPITKYFINNYLYKMVFRNFILCLFVFLWLNLFQGKNINPNFYIAFLTNLTFIILITRLIFKDIILFTNEYVRSSKKDLKKIAIYGAGSAGIQLLSALKYSKKYKVIFFIDDSKYFKNRIIDNKPIFSLKELNKYKRQIDVVFLAIPSLSLARKSEIIKSVRSLNLNIQIIPSLDQLASGKSKIGSIRNVIINDLLGRDPVIPDKKLLTGGIQGKNICITGAGGTIGRALCISIINLNPSKIILIENNELSLYSLNEELMALTKKDIAIIPCLINLIDLQSLENIFKKHKVDKIFHAAAYKHVPLVELNPISGIKNNVISTLNICNIALKYKIKNIVQISSDKAVRPTNLMGATKRICELIFINYQKRSIIDEAGSIYSIVRFGNVLGSSGSVIPLFNKQIEEGGPITITHPEIIRYFMTEEEASQLVIQSAMLSKGGEVFLLDMGFPKRIIDLAREMIWLSGMQEKNQDNPDGDIEIIYTGLRPGEKLYEEILIESNAENTNHPRIFKSKETQKFKFNFEDKLNQLIEYINNYEEIKSIETISEIVYDWTLSKEIKRLISKDNI